MYYEAKHPYTEYYIRSAFGYMVICSQEDFEFALFKIENELPGSYNEYVTGFGIQITKWMYQGKELLRMKDYEENYEEVDPLAEEDQKARANATVYGGRV